MERYIEECKNCKRCKLGQTRKNTVFGIGNIKSKIMFVGEGPGEREDETGIPFVGKAGQLFDKFFAATGIDKNEIYITNMIKCRPPHNRDPQPDEIEACIYFLRKQVAEIDPEYIVCVGRIAAENLIDANLKITKDHGKWYERGKFKMCAIYHPSFLLRNESYREEMLADMLNISKLIKK